MTQSEEVVFKFYSINLCKWMMINNDEDEHYKWDEFRSQAKTSPQQRRHIWQGDHRTLRSGQRSHTSRKWIMITIKIFLYVILFCFRFLISSFRAHYQGWQKLFFTFCCIFSSIEDTFISAFLSSAVSLATSRVPELFLTLSRSFALNKVCQHHQE